MTATPGPFPSESKTAKQSGTPVPSYVPSPTFSPEWFSLDSGNTPVFNISLESTQPPETSNTARNVFEKFEKQESTIPFDNTIVHPASALEQKELIDSSLVFSPVKGNYIGLVGTPSVDQTSSSTSPITSSYSRSGYNEAYTEGQHYSQSEKAKQNELWNWIFPEKNKTEFLDRRINSNRPTTDGPLSLVKRYDLTHTPQDGVSYISWNTMPSNSTSLINGDRDGSNSSVTAPIKMSQLPSLITNEIPALLSKASWESKDIKKVINNDTLLPAMKQSAGHNRSISSSTDAEQETENSPAENESYSTPSSHDDTGFPDDSSESSVDQTNSSDFLLDSLLEVPQLPAYLTEDSFNGPIPIDYLPPLEFLNSKGSLNLNLKFRTSFAIGLI